MLQIFLNNNYLDQAFEFMLQKIMYYIKCLQLKVKDDLFGAESDEMERYIIETCDIMNNQNFEENYNHSQIKDHLNKLKDYCLEKSFKNAIECGD